MASGASPSGELIFRHLFGLRRLLNDIRFEHIWEGAGGATRSYAGFTAMANEEERSRVWGGIHFTFDQTAGQSAGRNVANYVFLNFMKPRCDR